MSSRRAPIEEGSLDLLLDTITNAFGGILLVAILVVVLLRSTSQRIDSPDADVALDVTELAAELQRLEQQVSSITLEIQAVDAISAKLAKPELRTMLATLEVQKKWRDELSAEKAKILERIASTELERRSIDEKQETLTAEMQSESVTIESLRGALQEERAKREIDSPFPEERPASKNSFAVTVRYGRWYVERSAGGTPNLDDFAVLDSSGEFLTITPKPYRGVSILDDRELSSAIRRELSNKDPDRDYIDISIWDDSYEEFQLLRDHLVGDGFEYRLIAVADGDEVIETIVPDPQVQ